MRSYAPRIEHETSINKVDGGGAPKMVDHGLRVVGSHVAHKQQLGRLVVRARGRGVGRGEAGGACGRIRGYGEGRCERALGIIKATALLGRSSKL